MLLTCDPDKMNTERTWIFPIILCLPQGRCRLPVSGVQLSARGLLAGVPLLPLRSEQCLLIYNDNLMAIRSSSVLLDNLYLRVGPRPTLPTAITMIPSPQQSAIDSAFARSYLTDVTIQSNGASHSIGMDIQSNSQSFLEGSLLPPLPLLHSPPPSF